MAFDALRNSALPRAVGETFADLADLVQKELRLARAELAHNIATKTKGVGYTAAAALCVLVAFIVALQALIFGIASYGVAIHWAAAIVASGVLAIGALLFLIGRAKLKLELTPARTINQVKRDIRLTKEGLT